MSMIFTGFPPAASVSLYRPKATPGAALPAAIATVAADAAGTATFADQTGGEFLAISGTRRVWQRVAPGYTGTTAPVGYWSAVP